MIRPLLGAGALTLVFAVPALAQPVVDGTIAGDPYGAAASVQAVQTQFGDNLSELDAAYCAIANGRLYLALTGNLEDNFNKLEIFIDSKAGGENTLTGAPGNDNSFNMAGMSFDAGFEPDYHIIARRGFFEVNRFDLDFSELGTANFSFYGDVFGGTQEGSGATGVGLNVQPIEVAFDNSNVAGVGGGDQAANQLAALSVQTGVELSIALTDIGSPAGPIGVCAFVNNADHNYASNQFLGPLTPPQGNLGGDGAGTFTGTLTFSLGSFPGDQYFLCSDPATPTRSISWSRIKAIYR